MYIMKSVQVLRSAKQFSRRWESTLHSTTAPDEWLESVLPRESFLTKNLRNAVQKEQFSNRITELRLFHNTFPDRCLPKLDDSSWLTFLKMHLAEERAEYLITLSNFNSKENNPTENPTGGRLISEINKEKDDRDEMVYAPGFHSLLELQGKDFRRSIDSIYGSKLLSQERLDESLPKLIVDCRFLKDYSVVTQTTFAKQINSLQNVNWKSRNPFNVIVANFAPDRQLADIVKRTWRFRYGPDGSPSFQPHPLIPAITSRGIKETAECDPDSIMYISSKATEFLPVIPPSNVKAVVLCASMDCQPWSSSLSASQKDGIKAYRIPVYRHALIAAGQKTALNLPNSLHILSEYFSHNDIGKPIQNAVEMQSKKSKPTADDKSFVEMYRQICESLEREQANKRKHHKWLGNPLQKTRIHRYCREERKKMRNDVPF